MFKKLGNFLGDWAENTAGASNDLRKIADEMDNDLIAAGEKMQNASGGAADKFAQTMRKNKFGSFGAKFGMWLSEPVNMLMAAAGLVGGIWLIVSMK